VEAYQSEDRTIAVGAAIVQNAEFQWFIGITRRVVSVTSLVWLKKGFEVTIYITKGTPLFSGSSFLRISQLSILGGEQS